MKAIVYTKFGPPEVLQLQEVEKPVPKDNEVLIKVFATSVNAGDCNARGFTFVPSGFGLVSRLMFGLKKPKRNILGFELAGEIEAVGKKVELFKVGDYVFGSTGKGLGAYAEYKCLPEDGVLAIKPVNLTYEEAAVVPFGAVTALYFLRDLAHIQNGQKVLINGASGSTGTYAIQLARYFGAHVTGVCSTRNMELVESLGANELIDYTKEDFRTSGKTYDMIFDPVVGKVSFSDCGNSLKPNGLYLAVAGGPKELIQTPWTSMRGGKKVLAGSSPERKEDLIFLRELIEAGKIKPVIDRYFFLDQMIDAHHYADKGHKKGNIAITVIKSHQGR
jgi:NADPH:quinone reductase-like Zn-dependent oxidoreductase